MSRRVRMLYEWSESAGKRKLQPAGTISEARLWAWEYAPADGDLPFDSASFHDTVRIWITSRPDLRIPETLLVGDAEEILP